MLERHWRGDRDLISRHRDYSYWDSDRWYRDWDDWPSDWPRPGELVRRWRSDFDRPGFWNWPSEWPRMDDVMPRFSSHLDQVDRDWRSDPFWLDLYPRWAEPIFKEGIDIKTKIVNDSSRFAVEIDAYQFRPEEIQVKTIDDTLLIEGRHEDVRDRENFTKMYFVRKYQLPPDVNPVDISSTIDSTGRLTVEGTRQQRLQGRERLVPIEGPSRRADLHLSRNDASRIREETGFYGPPAGESRSHSSSYSYHHSRTTSGSPAVSTYDSHRERDIPVNRNVANEIPISHTGSGTRTGDRNSSDEFRSREYRAESKNDYRSQSSRQDSGFHESEQRHGGYSSDSAGGYNGASTSRRNGTSDNVRSIPILKKTFK